MHKWGRSNWLCLKRWQLFVDFIGTPVTSNLPVCSQKAVCALLCVCVCNIGLCTVWPPCRLRKQQIQRCSQFLSSPQGKGANPLQRKRRRRRKRWRVYKDPVSGLWMWRNINLLVRKGRVWTGVNMRWKLEKGWWVEEGKMKAELKGRRSEGDPGRRGGLNDAVSVYPLDCFLQAYKKAAGTSGNRRSRRWCWQVLFYFFLNRSRNDQKKPPPFCSFSETSKIICTSLSFIKTSLMSRTKWEQVAEGRLVVMLKHRWW